MFLNYQRQQKKVNRENYKTKNKLWYDRVRPLRGIKKDKP